jgi:hypothetical protein
MFINTSFLYPGKCFHTLANIPFFVSLDYKAMAHTCQHLFQIFS